MYICMHGFLWRKKRSVFVEWVTRLHLLLFYLQTQSRLLESEQQLCEQTTKVAALQQSVESSKKSLADTVAELKETKAAFEHATAQVRDVINHLLVIWLYFWKREQWLFCNTENNLLECAVEATNWEWQASLGCRQGMQCVCVCLDTTRQQRSL